MNPHHAVLYKPNPRFLRKTLAAKKKEPGKIHNIFIMSKSGQDINSNSST